MPAFIDIEGMRFGMWTVLFRVPWSYERKGTAWMCECDCGVSRPVLANSLRQGKSTGCGCKQYSDFSSRQTRHGQAKRRSETYEYTCWKHIISNCNNPNSKYFDFYGGRGIQIHNDWNEFDVFFKDMGPRPPGMMLGRENTDGHFEPGNCRWTTRKIQMAYRRRQS